MERTDGQNPFDPQTYSKPTTSLNSMLELRAFCAAFFDKRIRNGVNTDEADITSFLALIIDSPAYFARARAVIPELQAPDLESFHPNDKVKILWKATQGMRGPVGKKWEVLPEDLAWEKLARDGRESAARKGEDDGMRVEEQGSDASSSRGFTGNPTVLVHRKDGSKSSDSSPHSPLSAQSKFKSLPKKLDISAIPTFVPSNALGSAELVWSPTSGTRQRRPDEFYQPSTKARPETPPIQFGQGISPNVTPGYKSQHPFDGSRGFSDSPTKSHRHSESIGITPPQLKSTQLPLTPSGAWPPRSNESHYQRRERRNHRAETPFRGSVGRMTEMATLSHNPNSEYSPSSAHFDRTAYPFDDTSRTSSPSQFRGPRYPSNQARGVYGAEPFSAPPSVPGYGNLHQTGQGMYGGPPTPFEGQLGSLRPDPASFPTFGVQIPDRRPPSPFQGQLGPHQHHQSGPDAESGNAFAGQVPHMPNSENWPTRFSRPRGGGLSDRSMPQLMPQSQLPPPTIQAPNTHTLIVPPQGHMPPLDYWNMLHQRETEIRTRLQHANRTMTAQEHNYIALISEARINAAASQLPERGNISRNKRLKQLGKTLQGIWEPRPDGPLEVDPAIVAARKIDFEKAVQREIAAVANEGR